MSPTAGSSCGRPRSPSPTPRRRPSRPARPTAPRRGDITPPAASIADAEAGDAEPQPTIDTRIARPCRRTWPSRPEKNIARIPPTAAAADSAPTVLAPPPKMTAPAAGKSTRGWASSIAAMSATKVIRTLGALPGTRSRRAPTPAPAGSAQRPPRGSGRQRLQPPEPPQRGHRDERVGRVGRLEAAPVDETAGHQRPDHHRGVHREHRQRVGGRQQLALAGSAGRCEGAQASHREGAVPQRHQHVEHPDVRVAEPRLQGAHDARDERHRLRDQPDRAGRSGRPASRRTGPMPPAARARTARRSRPPPWTG